MKTGLTIAFYLLVTNLYAPVCMAEIYKYKDANGNWQFSDKPPQDDQKIERLDFKRSKKNSLPEDLDTHLNQKYASSTAVEKSTLAVVSIETKLGSGSGFFVSDDGYIVTNKHVVRPTDNSFWQKQVDSFEEADQKLKEAESKLTRRKAKLDKMYDDLAQYKKDIDDYSGSDKQVALSEYQVYKDRYNNMKRDYETANRQYKQKKREISQANTQFDLKSSTAKTAYDFKVMLKDGSKLSARLIQLSKEHDLALLKLDQHITPYLDITKLGKARQGMVVYAIGSPLGLKDFVTSGVITRARRDSIITDTQILPGNSGGPLIDQEGRLLGVNTQKLSSTKSIGSEGFGISIPVNYVLDEFGSFLE